MPKAVVRGDRLPPHDVEAEEAVIASALVDPETIPSMALLVKPSDFFREQNAWIWGVILDISRRDGATAVGTISVSHELARREKLEDVGGPAYLTRLTAALPTTVGCDYYAQIVRADAVYRRIISVAGQLARTAHEAGASSDEVTATLSAAMSLVESVAREDVRNGATSVRDLMAEQVDAVPVHKDGVLTGWPNLNKMLGSLRKGSLYIVAARPSHGKTSFATSLLRDVLTVGKKRALMFSLEMSKSQVAVRLTAAAAGVSSTRIEERIMDDAEERRVNFAQGKIGDTDGWLNDRARSLEQIELEVKAHALKYGLHIVVLDYLQLVEVRGKESRVQEVATVSRRLKALAVDMDIPIVALCQLSRAIESRSDSRPMLSDLKESGAIEQDADGVLFLYDGNKRPDSNEHPVDVIVGKNRLGRTGTIKMRFTPGTASFVQVE